MPKMANNSTISLSFSMVGSFLSREFLALVDHTTTKPVIASVGSLICIIYVFCYVLLVLSHKQITCVSRLAFSTTSLGITGRPGGNSTGPSTLLPDIPATIIGVDGTSSITGIRKRKLKHVLMFRCKMALQCGIKKSLRQPEDYRKKNDTKYRKRHKYPSPRPQPMTEVCVDHKVITDASEGRQVVDIIPPGPELLVSEGESIKFDQPWGICN
ncbi:hypothetical protein RND71_003844 [Anisodus tanguticus]|uniref:Uncharacterized protein n=1 Tax=Anisodus tanguticus TaxID=243964 RepID=A0AAE1SU13_9SOLA|nr:hypothetical protein RND71_003844 [Anisodus tanguticus]